MVSEEAGIHSLEKSVFFLEQLVKMVPLDSQWKTLPESPGGIDFLSVARTETDSLLIREFMG